MDSFRNISLHWRRFLGGLALVCIALYLVLLIPESEPPVPKGAQKSPFIWSQNELWSSLERDFIQSRSLGCDRLQLRIDSSISDINQLLDPITSIALNPQARHFDVLGQEVATLVDQKKEAGRYEVRWDAGGFGSGIYFYRMLTRFPHSRERPAKEVLERKKLILLR